MGYYLLFVGTEKIADIFQTVSTIAAMIYASTNLAQAEITTPDFLLLLLLLFGGRGRQMELL